MVNKNFPRYFFDNVILKEEVLSNYYLLDDSSVIKIEATSNGMLSKVDVSKNQLSPVPFITLSNNYNFSDSKTKKSNIVRGEDVKFPEFNSEIKKITPTPIKNKSI